MSDVRVVWRGAHWQVIHAGAVLFLSRDQSKAEAIAVALAEQYRVELIVYREEGTELRRHSFSGPDAS